MYLYEVLQLEESQASLRKIDLFLNSCNKNSLDYYKAFSYRSIMLHNLGKTNEALKALYAYVPDFNKIDDAMVVTICDAIIKITMDIEKFDETRKYVDIKKEHLKIANYTLNTIDEINLAMKLKDYSKALIELHNYLNDDASFEDLTWVYEKQAFIYYTIKDFDSYLEVANKLEKIYQDSLNTNKLIELIYSKLVIAHNENNYIKVICDGNRFLNDFKLNNTYKLKTATLLLESYIKNNDFYKAAIIESNYEEYLNDAPCDDAIAFCKLAIDFYTKKNSYLSVKHYEDLLNEFINKKNSEKPVSNKKPNVVIPKIKIKEEEQHYEEEQTFKVKYSDVPTLYLSTNYLQLEKLFKIVNNLDDTVKFREIYRQTLIELVSFIDFEESYLLYFDKTYQGLHYKKERVYDKHLDYLQIDNTANFCAMNQLEEFYLDENSTKGLKDIVTGTNFISNPYGIALPLIKDDLCYGSVFFWAKEPFLTKELAYETLRLVVQLLNHSILFELKQNEIKRTNRKLFFIADNMHSGIKEMMGSDIHLSTQAKEMLDCPEDLNENDFKARILASDLPKYNQKINEICQYMKPNESIEYVFTKGSNKINIKETFYPSYEGGTISLYSILENITQQKTKEKELIDIAYTNPLTKLESELKLMIDLREIASNRKLSLAVVDIKDIKMYEEFYGNNFANQLILAVAEAFKKAFSANFNVYIYHLEFDRYAILFKDINDKRTIDNLLLKVFNQVSKSLNSLNFRVNLFFNCGVYRLSKASVIKEAEKILIFAYDALNDAKDLKDNNHHIAHFDGEASKKRYITNQYFTNISEAIDNKKLGIAYKQIVNINNGEIFAYYAKISLESFDMDEDMMNYVIKRKGMEELLDKYVISHASIELKKLVERHRIKLHTMLKLNIKTIGDQLINFLDTQDNFYKTTKKGLIFYVDSAKNPNIIKIRKAGYLIASSNLYDLCHGYVDYFIYDLKEQGFEILEIVINLCKEKEIELIIANVKEKSEVEKLKEMNINYIYGDFYKKTIRMKKVLENLS